MVRGTLPGEDGSAGATESPYSTADPSTATITALIESSARAGVSFFSAAVTSPPLRSSATRSTSTARK
ncbi:MAG: hypothetical protein R3F14_37955 [Polyangiaceae bacterium]